MAEPPVRDADIAVIGAGAVGLATAYALAPRGAVVVIEANEAPGRETSSHNTGIVHAGMFYPTGTLKHRLCLEGNALLHEWADRLGVPLLRCGKLIVAVDRHDLAGLDRVWAQCLANEVPEVRRIDGPEANALEPRIRAAAAIWSGTSSVVDQTAYVRSIESAGRDRGVLFAYRHRVASAARDGDSFVIDALDGDGNEARLRVGLLVNAAGHGAPGIAAALGYPLDGGAAMPVLAQRVNRGVYYDFANPELGRAVSRTIYPVPPGRTVDEQQDRGGGLGIHLSVDVDGVAHLGPDTAWMPDLVPNGAPLAYRSVDEDRAPFLRAARRLLGDAVRAEDLVPGQVGYRPKRAVDGFADFVILEDSGYVHLGGIESPGLTASLAIGRFVADLVAR
ncbi:MAG: NAD(P)/FAD-dependent oxidoreductase [Dehalococcoidia bacterium]